MGKFLLALLALFIQLTTFACGPNGKNGFVPENNLFIDTEDHNANTMTKEKFNLIIDQLENIYRPLIKTKGKILDIRRVWENGTVNAYIHQIDKTWQISIFGGLARHPEITPDALVLVLCHELGHPLGGAPKWNKWLGSWSSTEGQADYFATLKCLRKYFEEDDNINIIEKMNIDPLVTEKCTLSYSHPGEQAICQRSSMAGFNLGQFFSALKNEDDLISFTTPDSSVVKKTMDFHSRPQCRLDTFFAGSLCPIDPSLELDNTDPTVNVCIRKGDNFHRSMARPLCWYRPKS
jgi:hypothetical protein